jgi:hypothetical protein
MSLWFVALGAGALFITSVREPILAFIALAVLGTASTHVMLESRAATRSQMVAGALVLPLAFLLCALAAVEFASQRGALVATGWTLAAVALSRVSHGRARPASRRGIVRWIARNHPGAPPTPG